MGHVCVMGHAAQGYSAIDVDVTASYRRCTITGLVIRVTSKSRLLASHRVFWGLQIYQPFASRSLRQAQRPGTTQLTSSTV